MQLQTRRTRIKSFALEDAIDGVTNAVAVAAVLIFLIATGFWPFYIIAAVMALFALGNW
ncbi:MAG: hypothetical protein AAF526_03170 [Pseudomonadota bacterium]